MMESVFRTISPRELKRLPARRGHDRKHLHQSRAVSGRKHEATETKTAYQEKMEAQLKKWSAKIGELTGGRRKGLG